MTNYSQNPVLSSPNEVKDEFYTFKAKSINPTSNDFQQEWSGYSPECTLKNNNGDEILPLQTANIKNRNLYNSIEIEGDKWMELACKLAKDSVLDKGGPFGAIILQIDNNTNRIIRYWTSYNQVTLTNDPTAHAEILAIRSACQSLGLINLNEIKKKDSKLTQPSNLSHCVIYSSTEPCPMCYSAICWAKIPSLLFAATRFDAAAKGVEFSDEEIYSELSKPYSKRKTKVFQCSISNSLDAFNLWKRTPNEKY